MRGSITLAQALDIMHQKDHRGDPIPFNISFYTCSLHRQTGGELISVDKALLTRNMKNVKGFTRSRLNPKKVNEHSNFIRNIYVPGAQQFYKVYIHLIETVNAMQVDW